MESCDIREIENISLSLIFQKQSECWQIMEDKWPYKQNKVGFYQVIWTFDITIQIKIKIKTNFKLLRFINQSHLFNPNA